MRVYRKNIHNLFISSAQGRSSRSARLVINVYMCIGVSVCIDHASLYSSTMLNMRKSTSSLILKRKKGARADADYAHTRCGCGCERLTSACACLAGFELQNQVAKKRYSDYLGSGQTCTFRDLLNAVHYTRVWSRTHPTLCGALIPTISHIIGRGNGFAHARVNVRFFRIWRSRFQLNG